GDAWIDEIRLTFRLASAKVGNERIALLEVHTCACKVEALVDIPTKWAADEKRIVEDCIEAGGPSIQRVGIARGIKAGQLETNPVPIVAQLESSHSCAYIHAAAGQPVKLVFAKNVVERIRD